MSKSRLLKFFSWTTITCLTLVVFYWEPLQVNIGRGSKFAQWNILSPLYTGTSNLVSGKDFTGNFPSMTRSCSLLVKAMRNIHCSCSMAMQVKNRKHNPHSC